ncbi:MAG: purine-binding chemotaxis protein CheW [Alphaproteobacteria bacterium]|nr:purine-binding chemotaxis protein CheW [Alphaproteobacteria bacterium]
MSDIDIDIDNAQRQVIVFEIAGHQLAVDIMAVREIRPWSPSTPLPGVPSFVRGVVNLRGVVLPVCDLGERLGWGKSNPSERHVIIVVQIDGQQVGLIADGVSDILTFPRSAVQPTGDVAAEAAAFLEGLVLQDQRMLLVLALDRLGLTENLQVAA